MQLDGQTIGAVSAAVVDEDELPGPVQGVEHRRQLLDESRQDLLLVVQRDDDRVPGCRLLHDSGGYAEARLSRRAGPWAPLPSHAMTAVLFTCAGQRVDIVTAFGRAGATTIASDLDPLAPALYHADHMALVPRVTDPGYLPALAALVAEYDVEARRPRDGHRPEHPRPRPRAARACAPARAAVRGLRDDGGQVRRAPVLRGARHREPSHVAPGRGAGRCALPAPREDPRRLRLPPHLPRRRCGGARLLPAPHARRIDGAGAVRRRGVLDRRLLRPRGTLPERHRAHDDPVEGRGVDQGHLDPRRGADRAPRARVAETVGIVGPACVQCFREPDGSLPVTDVNPRFGGAFPLPLAAGSRYPELALALANGERPEPRGRRVSRRRVDDALLHRGVPGRATAAAASPR